MDFLTQETNQRKNIALWMMFGGALIFTVYLFVSLWLVQNDLDKVFWLAVLAHIQLFTIMTGYITIVVKRRININKDGVSIQDAKQECTPGESQ